MRRVDLQDLTIKPFTLLNNEWALLVAGDQNPNPMTVSWGGLGTLWHRPVITVYVRPSRHTYGLLENVPEFTLNFLPERFKSALNLCGTKSGRDTNKWAAANIQCLASETLRVPRVAQARLVFECKVISSFDFSPTRFLDKSIEENYPDKSYHRAYIGQVINCLAED